MAVTETALTHQLDDYILDGKYQQRTGEHDALIRTLVHRAGKFQGDAHIFRNARSTIEEYEQNSASPRRKDVLFQAWAHYLAFYKKRTLSTECYDLYHHHFGGS